MLGIIAHHFVINSDVYQTILDGNPTHPASLYALVLGGWGKEGINVFLLITGYYACKSVPKLRNYVKLVFEIAFYIIVGFLIFYLSGYYAYSLKEIVKTFIPFYYLGMEFTTTYLVFWLFIPFINRLLVGLNHKSHFVLVVLLLLTDTMFQTLIRLPVAFTYMGWFFTAYIIAAYIRKCRDGDYKTKIRMFTELRCSALFMISSFVLAIGSIIAAAFVYKRFGYNLIWYFVADCNKILSIAPATGLFLVFINSKIGYSKWINLVGGSVFGVLCIHANGNAMRQWLWGYVIKSVEQYEYGLSHPLLFVIQSLVSIILIFTVCTAIDLFRRKFIEKPVMKKVDVMLVKHEWTDINNLYGLSDE